MRIISILEITLAALFVVSAPVQAWGPQGHRISAILAEDLLNKQARTAIKDLLGAQSLADASFWADQMRSNPAPFWQEKASAYHYVTVPRGQAYADVGAPGKGDAVTALEEFRRVLADTGASRAHKQLAMRFSLHIIQDLHQPLHVGNGLDRGGTRTRVRFLEENTNLHRVWDTDLILQAQRREGEWVNLLSAQLTRQKAVRWSSADPEAWIAESAVLRDSIYPVAGRIDLDYVRATLPALERRLLQSALRVATYFNSLFEKQAN